MSDTPEQPFPTPTEVEPEAQTAAPTPTEEVRYDVRGRRIGKRVGFAAAREGQKRWHLKNLARCRELLEGIYKDLPNSTMLTAKKMGVTIETIRSYRRELGLAQTPGRPGTLKPPEEQQAPSDKPIFTLGLNILDLFDRLMKLFPKVDDEADPEDEAEVKDEDHRLTWVAWRVFLAAAFGLPSEQLAYDHSKKTTDPDYLMPAYPGIDADVPRGAARVPAGASVAQIFECCTQRTSWPESASKILSLICGRRAGKSYVTAIIGIYLACCRQYHLNLGTQGMVMIIARDRQQAGVIRHYVLTFIKECPELALVLAGQPTQNLIELTNGVTIEVRAAGDAGTRGYTVVACLCDEIAFWPTEEESVKQDKKILRALRPAMLGIKGAMLVLLSSPYAKRGELFTYFKNWFGKSTYTTKRGDEKPSRVLVWNADTLSMRPDSNIELLEEIAHEYEDDPESASAEYGGLFRSDLESIYSRVAVEAVCVPGRFQMGYERAKRYRAFVDPSGGSSDSYTLAIAYDEMRKDDAGISFRVPVLVQSVEFKAPFKPSEISPQVVSILKQFRITSVTGDRYAGEWPREPLQKSGIRYVLCEKSRSELYLDFLPILNSGRCELLDAEHHKVMVNQFANLERRVGRSGKDSVDHPPGGHDDVANAVAGVMVMTGGSKRIHSTW